MLDVRVSDVAILWKAVSQAEGLGQADMVRLMNRYTMGQWTETMTLRWLLDKLLQKLSEQKGDHYIFGVVEAFEAVYGGY